MVEDRDSKFMKMALDVARAGFDRGELPVGAVLVIGGEYVGSAGNRNISQKDSNSHAEVRLIREHSATIYQSVREGAKVELFSSWEPCLMCFGTSVLNKVGRIVYACPDPRGGATGISLPNLIGYQNIWPKVFYDTRFREESCDLLLAHMVPKAPRWEKMVNELTRLRDSW